MIATFKKWLLTRLLREAAMNHEIKEIMIILWDESVDLNYEDNWNTTKSIFAEAVAYASIRNM